MKTLVVYFTRTGYTRRVAEQLAAALGDATLCPITELRSRAGFFGYQRCLIEAVFGLDADIEPPAHDPAGYDLVLLGTPIWGWHLASPVRAFARRHAGSIKRCGLFCTMGGAGAAAAFTELQQHLGRAPLATLALTDAEIDGAAAAAKIAPFVASLRGAA